MNKLVPLTSPQLLAARKAGLRDRPQHGGAAANCIGGKIS